jgi:hypothetical protein
MELFVHRFKDCDAKQLISALAKIGYTLDVSPRLHVKCSPCIGMTWGSEELDNFLQKLPNNAEMDLVFRIS